MPVSCKKLTLTDAKMDQSNNKKAADLPSPTSRHSSPSPLSRKRRKVKGHSDFSPLSPDFVHELVEKSQAISSIESSADDSTQRFMHHSSSSSSSLAQSGQLTSIGTSIFSQMMEPLKILQGQMSQVKKLESDRDQMQKQLDELQEALIESQEKREELLNKVSQLMAERENWRREKISKIQQAIARELNSKSDEEEDPEESRISAVVKVEMDQFGGR